ncbi:MULTISPECIES: NAD(P)/FAD-dependent oxidoreductase [Caulobacter]|uniref:Flavoprotein, HI0933 family n=1 Tax=Caulobacter vibrioides OR37 TaxID=1292034 RepID=R0EPM5_CAUVI|nr:MULTISPECIES: NAD(P)/FAD-dependent oxidoreductase [Caulobacter]ENZ83774.1 flavoprotein, HI0933 family [Caulobacter vibrioides OR37]MBQ1563508.1 NAD(P)/FAD-dependent oxidoreductase [Caulobacter sp.]
MEHHDVLVIGAGAAGMMCAIEAGKRGRSVLVVDHAKAPGEKIRISGGGRCNFTNLGATHLNFLSANPKFCVSALRRYRPRDFIALVERHGVAYHEKTLGQLFCDGSARQIVDLLLAEMRAAGVQLRLETRVEGVTKTEGGFEVALSSGKVACASLVVASGGKSIPKMGATGLGYDIARQFGLGVVDTRPALVPLTFEPATLARLSPLSGIGLDAVVSHGKTKFREGMLFTHRGLSGPSILQISSYWREGDEIRVDMAPGVDALAALKAARTATPRQAVATVLSTLLPRRVAQLIADEDAPDKGNIADCSDKVLGRLAGAVNAWTVKPAGSEGYRTAEVTLGGVDTDALDSRTLEAKAVAGLYFIGEVVDVTGWLGGYNFQWAWASGWSAGQSV